MFWFLGLSNSQKLTALLEVTNEKTDKFAYVANMDRHIHCGKCNTQVSNRDGRFDYFAMNI